MKNNLFFLCWFFGFSLFLTAQNPLSVYATMDADDALHFKDLFPNEVQILKTNGNQAAVFLSEEVTHKIHHNVQTHGPGYIFKDSEEKAIAAIQSAHQRTGEVVFTITEDAFVNECLDLVDANNIEADILHLQNYGTRYHTKPQAVQAVMDQKAKWDQMIADAGRTDIHTRIYNHVNTPMPSVILTIDGADSPDEFVIIGGHIDSTSWDKDDAPGADDNASGIASLNEMVRILLEKEFYPSRTIEVMAYAAEEIGLVGSDEIAHQYFLDGVDVVGYVQFDMTGYKGSSSDIYITTDYYNSTTLNDYLATLMDHYNSTGDHAFTYSYTECGYGCSDHASWASYGYQTSFPFEAAMSDSNPNIHSPNDVYSFFDTPNHSMKFTKLGLEFLIETAKPRSLGVSNYPEPTIACYVKNKLLTYNTSSFSSSLREIVLYNAVGQKIASYNVFGAAGTINLQQLSGGLYFVKFIFPDTPMVAKKILLH